MTSLCWAGSISGKPEWEMVKKRPLGVIVPCSRWCGVRACELRNSLLGLLRVRITEGLVPPGKIGGGYDAGAGERVQKLAARKSGAVVHSDPPEVWPFSGSAGKMMSGSL